MSERLLAITLAVFVTAGCQVGERPAPFTMPGPTVPSTTATVAPYTWDTDDELADWVSNRVTHGPLVVQGTGAEAFIRIDRAEQPWLVRGPDLSPAASGIRTVRLRYRWRPDPSLSPTASQVVHVTATLQTTTPIHSFDPTAQAAAHGVLQPQAEWTDITMTPGQYAPPIDVSYCYVHSLGANRGVLDIDRIELVRQGS